jgi:uncharacterized protein YcnI
MAQRKFSRVTIIAIALVGLALTMTAFGAISVRTSINSSGSIVTSLGTSSGISATSNVPSSSLSMYSDSACTVPMTTINWGSVSSGGTITRTVYVKNTGGGVSLTLSMATSNWNPTNANGPLTVTWDKEGSLLAPGQSTAATITLSVSSSITGITSFSVQILIYGTG